MSKINPEPNLIHIMGCYVLGNPNGEKVRPFPSSPARPGGSERHLGLVLLRLRTMICLSGPNSCSRN